MFIRRLENETSKIGLFGIRNISNAATSSSSASAQDYSITIRYDIDDIHKMCKTLDNHRIPYGSALAAIYNHSKSYYNNDTKKESSEETTYRTSTFSVETYCKQYKEACEAYNKIWWAKHEKEKINRESHAQFAEATKLDPWSRGP